MTSKIERYLERENIIIGTDRSEICVQKKDEILIEPNNYSASADINKPQFLVSLKKTFFYLFHDLICHFL